MLAVDAPGEPVQSDAPDAGGQRGEVQKPDEGVLPDAEILQVSAARSKVLGRYHMMMGQNPVYIISAGGRKPGQV